MRFLVEVTKPEPASSYWQVSISPPQATSGWPLVRTLQRVQSRAWFFPLPSQEDLPPATEPHYSLCVDIRQIRENYEAIVKREPLQNGIENFGRYLFDTLIGQKYWQKIRDVANGHEIELALAWAPIDSDLHCLNWEMMYSAANTPLAWQGIAITRLVMDTDGEAPALGTPPRILFVVGTSLADPSVRPGAEFYGLLRQLKATSGRALHTQILQQATPKQLVDAVKRFRPDIVHFISHGDIADGRGYLEMQLDANEKDERLRQRYAKQLIAGLKVEGKLPAMVVLSACNTGLMQGANKTAPLAAELVQLGIPVVVGMAGRISNLACRLFTRQFGHALVAGKPIIKAVTEGRRKALVEGPAPHNYIDWALPAVYMGKYVPVDFASAPYSDSEKELGNRLKVYDVERSPVFCDRDEFLEAYYGLVDPGFKPVLIAYGDTGIGKTRLLQELTAQAVRDGHIPIPLLVEFKQEPPYTMMELADALWKTLKKVSEAYPGSSLPNCQLRLLAKGTQVGLLQDIEDELDNAQQPSPLAIQLALQHDAYALKTSIRQEHPELQQSALCPIVLLDDIHVYPTDFVAALFQQGLLSGFGLGRNGAPIPVIMTFALEGPLAGTLKEVIDFPLKRPWMQAMELKKFREDDDGVDMLVYERVLLNPFNPPLWPPQSSTPYVMNSALTDTIKKKWTVLFRKKLKGMPRNLERDDLYLLAETALGDQFLEVADDEALLQKEPQS